MGMSKMVKVVQLGIIFGPDFFKNKSVYFTGA
jgi:hypothetical protein